MTISLKILKEISAHAHEALKNVTQKRGYTKSEEETAKKKLSELGTVEHPKNGRKFNFGKWASKAQGFK